MPHMNLRRSRKTKKIRELLSTVNVQANKLIQPYFVYQGLEHPEDLPSITNQKKHTIFSLKKEIEKGLDNQVSSILLFIIPSTKQVKEFNYDFDAQVINNIKETFQDDINLFVDVCLCSNTLSGHCGFLDDNDTVDNDKTVKELAKKSLIYASAGADVISPSDMMDDRIKYIREALDQDHLSEKLIMSYSTKFSSNFYGPFRDAALSTPSKGNRKSYQIDFTNLKDALRSSYRDAQQGADILMVKPAGPYLDVICRLSDDPQTANLPLCAYQVSGEYQGLHVMHKAGLLDFPGAFYESLLAIKRAGADIIITYGANNFNQLMRDLN